MFFVLLALFFCIFYFGKPNKNIFKKTEIEKTAKIKMQKKTDTLTRAVSTIVFTNSVFFSFLCFFKFCIFDENTIKIGVSAPPPQKKKTKKNKKINKFYKLKTGPSIS